MKPNSMLAKLLGVEIPEAGAEAVAVQAQFDAYKETAEADKAQLAEALGIAVEANTALETQVDELKAQVEALQAAQAESEAKAADAKLAQRRARIEAALGSERGEAVMAVTANLTDENFEVVVDAMRAAGDKEAQSPMFQEQGVEATADATVAGTVSKEMQILRAKYNKAGA